MKNADLAADAMKDRIGNGLSLQRMDANTSIVVTATSGVSANFLAFATQKMVWASSATQHERLAGARRANIWRRRSDNEEYAPLCEIQIQWQYRRLPSSKRGDSNIGTEYQKARQRLRLQRFDAAHGDCIRPNYLMLPQLQVRATHRPCLPPALSLLETMCKT